MGMNEDVAAILQQRQHQGRPMPSIRQIRVLLGNKGSMTTISAAVKQWQMSLLKEEGLMPDGLTEEELRPIGQAIWQCIEPALRRHIQNARDLAQKKADLEKADAARVRQAADEIIDEARGIEQQYDELTTQLNNLKVEYARVTGTLQASHRTIEILEAETNRLKATLEEVLKAGSARRRIKRRRLKKAEHQAKRRSTAAATVTRSVT